MSKVSNIVIMMGSLHIEMTILSALGDWSEDSGWATLIYNCGVARVGIAKSLSSGSNVVHSRYCYQVTLCAPYRLRNKAFEQYFRNEDVVKHTYAEWCTMMEGKFPQFAFWSITMRMIRDLFLAVYPRSFQLCKMAICAFT